MVNQQQIENIDSWIKEINGKLEELQRQVNALTIQYNYQFGMLITITEILSDLELNNHNNNQIIRMMNKKLVNTNGT